MSSETTGDVDDERVRAIVQEEVDRQLDDTPGDVAVDQEGRKWTLGDLLGIGLTRREALLAFSALAGGMAFSRAIVSAVETAEAQTAAGQVGTTDRRLDVYGNTVDSLSVNTDEETLTNGAVQARYNVTQGDTTSDVITETFQSIQAAVDAVPTGAGRTPPDDPDTDNRAFGEVEILPVDDIYQESIHIPDTCLSLRGFGQGTEIATDGSNHTIAIQTNDVFMRDMQVDHLGTGDYDAINTAGDYDEIQLFRVTVDAAPRYAYNIQDQASHLIGCEAAGGDVASYRFAARECQGVGLKLTDSPANGILFDNGATSCEVTGVLRGMSGVGVKMDNIVNEFRGVVRSGGSHGVEMSGSNSSFYGTIFGCSSDGLRISGSGNNALAKIGGNPTGVHMTGSATANYVYLGRCTDPIQIDSGATENVIDGQIIGETVTDNGTRTLINGRGTNDGDPNSTGEWNGYASAAYKMGATIEDTTNGPLYKAKSDGTWSQIGT